MTTAKISIPFAQACRMGNEQKCKIIVFQAKRISIEKWEIRAILHICRSKGWLDKGLAVLYEYAGYMDDIKGLMEERNRLYELLLLEQGNFQGDEKTNGVNFTQILSKMINSTIRLIQTLCFWRRLQWSPRSIFFDQIGRKTSLHSILRDTSSQLFVILKDISLSTNFFEFISLNHLAILLAPGVQFESFLRFNKSNNLQNVSLDKGSEIYQLYHEIREIFTYEDKIEGSWQTLKAILQGTSQPMKLFPTLRLPYQNYKPPTADFAWFANAVPQYSVLGRKLAACSLGTKVLKATGLGTSRNVKFPEQEGPKDSPTASKSSEDSLGDNRPKLTQVSSSDLLELKHLPLTPTTAGLIEKIPNFGDEACDSEHHSEHAIPIDEVVNEPVGEEKTESFNLVDTMKKEVAAQMAQSTTTAFLDSGMSAAIRSLNSSVVQKNRSEEFEGTPQRIAPSVEVLAVSKADESTPIVYTGSSSGKTKVKPLSADFCLRRESYQSVEVQSSAPKRPQTADQYREGHSNDHITEQKKTPRTAQKLGLSSSVGAADEADAFLSSDATADPHFTAENAQLYGQDETNNRHPTEFQKLNTAPYLSTPQYISYGDQQPPMGFHPQFSPFFQQQVPVQGFPYTPMEGAPTQAFYMQQQPPFQPFSPMPYQQTPMQVFQPQTYPAFVPQVFMAPYPQQNPGLGMTQLIEQQFDMLQKKLQEQLQQQLKETAGLQPSQVSQLGEKSTHSLSPKSHVEQTHQAEEGLNTEELINSPSKEAEMMRRNLFPRKRSETYAAFTTKPLVDLKEGRRRVSAPSVPSKGDFASTRPAEKEEVASDGEFSDDEDDDEDLAPEKTEELGGSNNPTNDLIKISALVSADTNVDANASFDDQNSEDDDFICDIQDESQDGEDGASLIMQRHPTFNDPTSQDTLLQPRISLSRPQSHHLLGKNEHIASPVGFSRREIRSAQPRKKSIDASADQTVEKLIRPSRNTERETEIVRWVYPPSPRGNNKRRIEALQLLSNLSRPYSPSIRGEMRAERQIVHIALDSNDLDGDVARKLAAQKISVWWQLLGPRVKLQRRMDARFFVLELVKDMVDRSVDRSLQNQRRRKLMMRQGAALKIQKVFRYWVNTVLAEERQHEREERQRVAWDRLGKWQRCVVNSIRIYRYFRYLRRRRLRARRSSRLKVPPPPKLKKVLECYIQVFTLSKKLQRLQQITRALAISHSPITLSHKRAAVYKEMQDAAICIQKYYRRYLVLCWMEQWHAQRQMGARIAFFCIQSVARRRVRHKKKINIAATKIQKFIRGVRIRRFILRIVYAGLLLNEMWRKVIAYRSLKAQLRRVDRPHTLIVHGIRNIDERIVNHDHLRFKLSVWWNPLLHIVSHKDFSTILQSKQPQFIYNGLTHYITDDHSSDAPSQKNIRGSIRNFFSGQDKSQSSSSSIPIAALNQQNLQKVGNLPSITPPPSRQLSGKSPAISSPLVEGNEDEEEEKVEEEEEEKKNSIKFPPPGEQTNSKRVQPVAAERKSSVLSPSAMLMNSIYSEEESENSSEESNHEQQTISNKQHEASERLPSAHYQQQQQLQQRRMSTQGKANRQLEPVSPKSQDSFGDRDASSSIRNKLQQSIKLSQALSGGGSSHDRKASIRRLSTSSTTSSRGPPLASLYTKKASIVRQTLNFAMHKLSTVTKKHVPNAPGTRAKKVCNFEDEMVKIPGCHGNSVLKFEIFEGDRKLGETLFYLSREGEMMYWGGQYEKEVSLIQQRRAIQFNSQLISPIQKIQPRGVSTLGNHNVQVATGSSGVENPLLNFRIIAGVPLRSRCQWCRMVIRGNGPLKRAINNRDLIGSFALFDRWYRFFLSLDEYGLFLFDSKHSIEPFHCIPCADLKFVTVDIGTPIKESNKETSKSIVEDIHNVIVSTHQGDELYIRFQDAGSRVAWHEVLSNTIAYIEETTAEDTAYGQGTVPKGSWMEQALIGEGSTKRRQKEQIQQRQQQFLASGMG